MPSEFYLFILLLATVVIAAYFYLKRAQRRQSGEVVTPARQDSPVATASAAPTPAETSTNSGETPLGG